MRQNHTTIPWHPTDQYDLYEGYVAFCQRQRERLDKLQNLQRRTFVGTITAGYRNANTRNT